jgi:hypothetical protein
MSLVVTTISAHDIEVVNDDGITLYYKWMNNNTELAVSYRGDTPNQYINYKQEFSGDIVIPESVTYNGKTYSVTSIGERAFYFCGYMTSVTIPNSVKSIGELAFESCTGITSLTIGENVDSIAYGAFSFCTKLTSVEIPSSVRYLGDDAFRDCSNLTSVTIGNNVYYMGQDTFGRTKWYNKQPNGLVYAGSMLYKYKGTMPEGTTISINEGTLGIADAAFQGKKELTSVTIPNSVKYIGEWTFSGCTGLTSMDIPNSVTTIAMCAFSGCNGLTSLTIGNSVKTIGKYVFSSCSSLSSVSIPDNVTFIDEYAFSNCSGLQSITIGSGIETIEKNVFSYCGKMADVYCYAENVPSTNSNAFIGSPIESATLHIHRASLTSYSDTEPWKNFKNKVAVEDPVLTCETPTITVDGNSIKFECNTTDVIFHYTLSSFDAKSGTTSSGIEVNNNYTITVYASKEGYIDSEVARANCQIIGGKFGDLTGDGFVDVADHVKLSEIIMNQEQ